jgi:hypothetical protein
MVGSPFGGETPPAAVAAATTTTTDTGVTAPVVVAVTVAAAAVNTDVASAAASARAAAIAAFAFPACIERLPLLWPPPVLLLLVMLVLLELKLRPRHGERAPRDLLPTRRVLGLGRGVGVDGRAGLAEGTQLDRQRLPRRRRSLELALEPVSVQRMQGDQTTETLLSAAQLAAHTCEGLMRCFIHKK